MCDSRQKQKTVNISIVFGVILLWIFSGIEASAEESYGSYKLVDKGTIRIFGKEYRVQVPQWKKNKQNIEKPFSPNAKNAEKRLGADARKPNKDNPKNRVHQATLPKEAAKKDKDKVYGTVRLIYKGYYRLNGRRCPVSAPIFTAW